MPETSRRRSPPSASPAQYTTHGIPGADEVIFLPLGGAGEIGLNCTLYGHDGAWIMVDCGLTFASTDVPGVDIMLPDLAFVEEHRGNFLGLILTHAHEDHLGAIPYLYNTIRFPVYASAFAREVLQAKLDYTEHRDAIDIQLLPEKKPLKLGGFSVDPIRLTHSTLEQHALAITTRIGTIVHTGDWKLDPKPLVGKTSDIPKLKRIGQKGVAALVCDSTNIFEDDPSGSEADVEKALTKLFSTDSSRFLVTAFASNIARMSAVCTAAEKAGRKVALVGRAMSRMLTCAKNAGYLSELSAFVSAKRIQSIPDEQLVILCTGSQGEPLAALNRITDGRHPYVTIGNRDKVVFSARAIPGNEKAIADVKNRLIRAGAQIIDAPIYHVSGHAYQQDLRDMYGYLNPDWIIPVHGEPRHLHAHARFAQEHQISAYIPENGAAVRLCQENAPEEIDTIELQPQVVDAETIIALRSAPIAERKRMMTQGACFVTVPLTLSGEILQDPLVQFAGVSRADDAQIRIDFLEEITAAVENLSDAAVTDDHQVVDAVDTALRALLRKRCKTASLLRVNVLRIDPD